MIIFKDAERETNISARGSILHCYFKANKVFIFIYII